MTTELNKDQLNRHADRLFPILETLQSMEQDYVALVKEENQAVEHAQTMEVLGLESLQKLEEERLTFSLDTLGRFVQAQIDALDNMFLTLRTNNANNMDSENYQSRSSSSQQEYVTNRRRCNTAPVETTSTTTSLTPIPSSSSSSGLPSIITTPTTTHRFKGRTIFWWGQSCKGRNFVS